MLKRLIIRGGCDIAPSKHPERCILGLPGHLNTANVLQLEKALSDEMQKLRLKVKRLDSDKQMWARQKIAFHKELTELQSQLQKDKCYRTKLEECCINVGYPIASLKQSIDDSVHRDVTFPTVIC